MTYKVVVFNCGVAEKEHTVNASEALAAINLVEMLYSTEDKLYCYEARLYSGIPLEVKKEVVHV